MMLRWRVEGLLVGMACLVLAGPGLAQDGAGSVLDVGEDSDWESEAEAEEAADTGQDAYADYDDLYYSEEDTGDDGDPWEKMNRGIFSFNEGLDRWILEPVAKGWDWVLPEFAQRSVRNAFDNIQFPVRFTNNLLQWKPKDAGRDFGRFIVNSVVGIGGLMDPASTIGLTATNEDFGQTLGVWGVPTGPYLMLPILGPSNIRDGVGLGVDSSMSVISYFIPFGASVAATAVNTVNRRSLVIEELDAERRASLDFYVAVRSAYTQYREGVVKDRGDVDPGTYGLVSGGRREPGSEVEEQ